MRIMWVLLIFVLVSFARAETKQQETADVPWGKQPDHLEPLVPEIGNIGRYRDLIFKHLCITPAQFGRMALEIGFYEPEWVVSVYGEDEIGTNTTRTSPTTSQSRKRMIAFGHRSHPTTTINNRNRLRYRAKIPS